MEKDGITEIIIPEDKDSICRFCLNIPDEIILIKEDSNSIKWSKAGNLSAKEIFAKLSIKVDDMDYLPGGICNDCKNTLENFCVFLEKIESNEEILRNVYAYDISDTSDIDGTEIFSNDISFKEEDITNIDHAYGKKIEPEFVYNEFSNEESEDNEPSDYEDFANTVTLSVEENTTANKERKITEKPQERASTSQEYKKVNTEFGEYKVFNMSPSVVKIRVLDKKKTLQKCVQEKVARKKHEGSITIEKTIASRPDEYEETCIKQCFFCTKKFNSDGLRILHYVDHVVQATEGMVPHRPFCVYCGLLTSNKDDLDEHITEKHKDDDDLHCHECEIKFSKPDELTAHLEKNHDEYYEEEISTVNKCPICDEIFDSIDALVKHSLIHISRRYTCMTCKNIFICDAALNEHHRDHPQYRFKCPICQRLTSGKHALRAHIATHTTSKNFECDVCGRRYKTKNHFLYHRGSHFRPKLICTHCAYSTPSSKDFTIHMRIHSDERPFECTFEDCNKTFKTNSSLSLHVKKHFNILDFACDMCDYKTNRSTGLRIHKRKHTGEKPFVCKLCSKGFNRNWNLSLHMKKSHA